MCSGTSLLAPLSPLLPALCAFLPLFGCNTLFSRLCFLTWVGFSVSCFSFFCVWSCLSWPDGFTLLFFLLFPYTGCILLGIGCSCVFLAEALIILLLLGIGVVRALS